METTLLLRKFMNLVHYDRPLNSLPFITIMIIGALGSINSGLVIFHEKLSQEKLLTALKENLLLIIVFSWIAIRGLKPSKPLKLVELIESDFLVSENELNGRDEKWRRLENYYNNKRDDMRGICEGFLKIIIIIFLGILSRNLVVQLTEDTNDETQDWPTPFVYWCPEGYDNYTFFLLIYTLHAILLLIMGMEGFCLQVSTCLAIERVIADFETINMLLRDMVDDFPDDEDYVDDQSVADESDIQVYRGDNCREKQDLRGDMGRIVRCHQKLNRNFKECAESCTYGIFSLSFIVCVDSVLSIFIMLKAVDLKTKVMFAITTLSANLLLLLIYGIGQRIINQNDIFRRCLSEVAWTDKPKWFKSSLHIMIGFANTDIQMKPYGIYVLNYETLKNILKASFTFGNFFYTMAVNSNQMIL
ncbi:uncharacterized protein LOC111062280 isoform X2 [Nilaparvata lugens]|nr:uncharacterized protein LOC111062280 isoform X2 [Nilaparvata lugens]XP_039281842.1 uncharacterized protein LOC111062280 isoform X2 [Nilaparvata lugens]XP_039281843.1 uncharacterized protein LOC111062280 isoform X2 [Nilaparvata lugens]